MEETKMNIEEIIVIKFKELERLILKLGDDISLAACEAGCRPGCKDSCKPGEKTSTIAAPTQPEG